MACKYTGLTAVIIPISALLAWTLFGAPGPQFPQAKIRSNKAAWPALMFLVGISLTVGPWLVKNAVFTGNPVYPLAYRFFGGDGRDEELDQKWRQGHAAKTYSTWKERLFDLPVKISDVMANNDWHSPLMFGLAPLSLWWLRRRTERADGIRNDSFSPAEIVAILWAYIAWQFATWWLLTHHIDRFYVPMFSVVGLLAGIGLTWPMLEGLRGPGSRDSRIWKSVTAVIVVAAVLYNVQIMVYIGGFNAGRLDLKVAEQIAIAPRIQWLNDKFESGQFPSQTKVLCVGEAGLFHARYPYLYNTVFDRSLFEQICSAPDAPPGTLRPTEEIRDEFRRRGITHIDVNWAEIQRYRAPGSYGYPDFVQPERFAELQRLGLIGRNLLTTSQAGEEESGQVFPVLAD